MILRQHMPNFAHIACILRHFLVEHTSVIKSEQDEIITTHRILFARRVTIIRIL